MNVRSQSNRWTSEKVTTTNTKNVTPTPSKDKAKETMGAKINITLFALAGIIVSFENNLTPSAKGWSNPNIPTTLGPFLYCTAAITFLSK